MASVTKRRWTHNGATKEAWTVRYFDEKGVRRSKQFEQKKVADGFKRKVEREIEDGTHTADGETATIDRIAKEFVAYAEQRHADGRLGRSRYSGIESAIRLHILPEIGRVRMTDVKWSHVDALRAALTKKGMAPYTVKGTMSILGAIEDFARKRGYVKTSVIREALKDASAITAERIRVPSETEVRAILLATEDRGMQSNHERSRRLLQLYVYLGAFAGLRFGEISGLTLASLDFDSGVIEVRHSLTRWDELKEPKTRSGIRDVPMAPEVRRLLLEWINQGFYHPNERQLVFRSRAGTSMSGGNFHVYMWGPLLKHAGMADSGEGRFHFHALRHFFASMLVNANLPITDVASIMGHRKYDMTLQVYARPIAGGSRRAAAIEAIAGSAILALNDARVTQAA